MSKRLIDLFLTALLRKTNELEQTDWIKYFDRKELKPEQARPNNNDIFRKRDLLHNRVKRIY